MELIALKNARNYYFTFLNNFTLDEFKQMEKIISSKLIKRFYEKALIYKKYKLINFIHQNKNWFLTKGILEYVYFDLSKNGFVVRPFRKYFSKVVLYKIFY